MELLEDLDDILKAKMSYGLLKNHQSNTGVQLTQIVLHNGRCSLARSANVLFEFGEVHQPGGFELVAVQPSLNKVLGNSAIVKEFLVESKLTHCHSVARSLDICGIALEHGLEQVV
uniref:DUF4346 domain-containing protein n=1 Tax=Angiostrongylus cantonensis TaxID=6313 RepID=A0A0K0DLB8_ANGCA